MLKLSRRSTLVGTSRRLVSDNPSWPFSFRPASHIQAKNQCLDKTFSVQTKQSLGLFLFTGNCSECSLQFALVSFSVQCSDETIFVFLFCSQETAKNVHLGLRLFPSPLHYLYICVYPHCSSDNVRTQTRYDMQEPEFCAAQLKAWKYSENWGKQGLKPAIHYSRRKIKEKEHTAKM